LERWRSQFPDFNQNTGNTGRLQSKERLRQLSKDIKRLKPIRKLPSQHFFDEKYILFFDGIGAIQVNDRFYRLQLGCETYRIFENLAYAMPSNI